MRKFRNDPEISFNHSKWRPINPSRITILTENPEIDPRNPEKFIQDRNYSSKDPEKSIQEFGIFISPSDLCKFMPISLKNPKKFQNRSWNFLQIHSGSPSWPKILKNPSVLTNKSFKDRQFRWNEILKNSKIDPEIPLQLIQDHNPCLKKCWKILPWTTRHPKSDPAQPFLHFENPRRIARIAILKSRIDTERSLNPAWKDGGQFHCINFAICHRQRIDPEPSGSTPQTTASSLQDSFQSSDPVVPFFKIIYSFRDWIFH